MVAAERTHLLEILQASEANLVAMLNETSEDLFLYKPNEDTWSMAELVEHLLNTDAGLLVSIQKKAEDIQDTMPDVFPIEKIVRVVSNRTHKVKAPDFLIPKGQFKNKAEAIAAFRKNRATIEDFVATTDFPMDKIAFKHFALGLIDAKGWIIFMAGHCERHLLQMGENRDLFRSV